MRNNIMTSTVWEEGTDPTGWWMSEKYDGVRLFWNGSAFYTRQGKKLRLPLSITSQMPNIALDGELWFINNPI
jgi:DNA ligase-1